MAASLIRQLNLFPEFPFPTLSLIHGDGLSNGGFVQGGTALFPCCTTTRDPSISESIPVPNGIMETLAHSSEIFAERNHLLMSVPTNPTTYSVPPQYPAPDECEIKDYSGQVGRCHQAIGSPTYYCSKRDKIL